MNYQFEWRNNGTNNYDYRRMYELGYICMLGDDEMDICRMDSEEVLLTVKQGDRIFVNRNGVEKMNKELAE